MPSASCVNTHGSYECHCPVCGKKGDGFKDLSNVPRDLWPSAYLNGSGCVDSCAPSITLHGPNPKIFRIAKVSRHAEVTI